VNFVGVGIPSGSLADLDALEVWGPNGISDSDKFSLASDVTTGVSIWSFTGALVLPYMTQAEVAFGLGLPLEAAPLIDVDALMVFDTFDPGPLPLWQPGDSVLFSLAPIPALGFDGGEIWSWTNGAGFATFLSHGGHLWDTANDVTALLGSEDVDALEDVSPEVFFAEHAAHVHTMRPSAIRKPKFFIMEQSLSKTKSSKWNARLSYLLGGGPYGSKERKYYLSLLNPDLRLSDQRAIASSLA
jgi:hypothetical protein